MPALTNPRHEQFVQLVAGGINHKQAFVLVGFSKKGAKSAASRLLTNVRVRTRLDEILSTAEQSVVAQATVTKAWVLMDLAENCTTDSVKCKAYELCGKAIGMFVDRSDHTLHWDGDPKNLTLEQKIKLAQYELELAYPGDPVAQEAAKQRARIEAGVVDVEFVPAPP